MPSPKQLGVYLMSGTSQGMGSPDFNNLTARVSRLEDIAPQTIRGNTFAGQGRNRFSPIDSTGIIGGKLNLSTASGINFKGIMAPTVVDGQFTVGSSDTAHATIYWDGTNSSRVILIRRADGTTTTITPNNITISGLTASATYQVYAFWVPFNQCGLGFAAGTTGTPQICIASTDSDTTAVQAQSSASQAGREFIGNVSWTQPASGSTSPGTPTSPPSRQPGTCVRLGTHIEVLGHHGKSDVQECQHKNDKWVHLETDGGLVLECTPDHRLYHDDKGKIEAQYIVAGDPMITRFGVQHITKVYPFIHGCVKVEVKMKHGHQFYANGFLSHNTKLNS